MLTVAYITSRKEPHIEWFLDSLARYSPAGCGLEVIIVDGYNQTGKPMTDRNWQNLRIRTTEPKPCIWSGPHRITKEDFWSKSNSQNTAICLCETSHLAFVDDRSVLSPAWLPCVEDAIQGGYAVSGAYEKRANMKVSNGEIVNEGQLLGRDTRTPHEQAYRVKDWYGGSGALPLEWCLAVNGFSEDLCDSLGSEDSCFGITLRNSGYDMAYDPRMLIIEDRTPDEIGGSLRRSDWGVSPNDASHKIIEIMRDKTTSQNSYDIRNLRDRIQAGEPWPAPSASHVHWFSGEDIATKFV